MNIIYTVCNRTTLAHALTLADSVAQHQPDALFNLCWVDAAPLKSLPAFIQVTGISEITIPGWEEMKSRYFDFELLAACRPWFAQALLSRFPACEQLTFLAPTVVLFESMTPVLAAQSDFYLTPNILKPLGKSAILDDKRILNVGMFHAGSWTARNQPDVHKALAWWAKRTVDRAFFDLCNGMNADQLWLNYVPVWVPKTQIVANPGWHYGLHAVLNKNLSVASGKYTVDGQPLISVDFAGLTIFDPVWSNHNALVNKSDAFRSLLREYKSKLASHQRHLPVSDQPAYGKTPEIRKYRVLRNNLAKKLKAVTAYIDQF